MPLNAFKYLESWGEEVQTLLCWEMEERELPTPAGGLHHMALRVRQGE